MNSRKIKFLPLLLLFLLVFPQAVLSGHRHSSLSDTEKKQGIRLGQQEKDCLVCSFEFAPFAAEEQTEQQPVTAEITETLIFSPLAVLPGYSGYSFLLRAPPQNS